MRPFLIFIFSAFAMLSSVEANVKNEIVTGAFSTPDRAHLQNTKVEAYLGNSPAVAPMIKEKRFYFDVKYFNGNYRAVMTHFTDQHDMLTVLNVTRRIYPEAYTTAATPLIIPPTKTETPETATPESVPAPAPITTVAANSNAVVSEEPAYAAAPAHQAPLPAGKVETIPPKPVVEPEPAPAAKMPDTDNVIDSDITAIDEIESAQENTPSPAPEIRPVAEPEPMAITPAEEETVPLYAEMPYLLYGIAAAGVLLIMLLLFARQKSKPKLGHMINLSPIEKEAEESETLEQNSYEPSPEPEEPEVEFTDLSIQEPSRTEFVAPEVAFSEPETAVMPEPVMPVQEETAVSRKKRSAPLPGEPVTKEKLADFTGNRILVAEDNLINQKVITKLFEGSGIEIVIAENGQEAIDILNNDPNYNMVLMDAHMPVKDGFEATREIRRNILLEPVPVVALSGDVSSDDIRKMKEAGMEEQLAKPLRVEALYNVMYQYLDFPGEAKEAAEEEEEMLRLEDSAPVETIYEEPALNKAEGLEICNGDKTMYMEILEDFVQSYSKSDELVITYIRSNEDIKLVALLLDIKGVAANIGADPLSESAETLREAVLINHSESYEPLAKEYSKELNRLIAAIEAYRKSV